MSCKLYYHHFTIIEEDVRIENNRLIKGDDMSEKEKSELRFDSVNRLTIKRGEGVRTTTDALDFSEEEMSKFLDKHIRKYVDVDRFTIPDVMAEIWNDDSAPLNVRLFGLVSLGRLCEYRDGQFGKMGKSNKSGVRGIKLDGKMADMMIKMLEELAKEQED